MKLPNGFGSIHLIEKGAKKKRRNPYRARVVTGYTPEGKAVYYNVGYFATQMDAYEALVAYHKNPLARNETITVGEIYHNLMETSFTNLSVRRVETFISIFKNHVSALSKVDIKDVKVNQLEIILVNKTKNVQKEILTLMKKIFEWAVKNEYVDKNYAEFVKVGDVAQAEVTKSDSKPFTDEEVLRLWKLYRDGVKYSAEALVMLYTGIRRGELETFVKYDGYFIGGIKTEAGRGRVIPIHPDIEEVLSSVDYNITMHNVYNFIKKHFNHKLHDTRHTFVTNMRKNKADDVLLKAIVGHQSNDVTDIYTHLAIEDIVGEITKLNLPKC